MKKLLSIILILCLTASLLAACGQDTNKKTADSSGNTQQPSQSEGQPDETEGDTQPSEGPAEEISLKDLDITLVTQGETMELYTGTVPVGEVTFGTKNENVATFALGVVTAVGKGETTVYAEHGGVRIECNVYCNIKETPNPTEPTQGNTTQPTEGNTTEPTTPSKPAGSRDPVMAAPSNQTVDSSFFDDAVFVGDSISLKLSQYAASSGALGKAKFLVVGSYGVNNAVYDHPDTKLTYQGVKYTNVEEALAATGAKKVFIMLGMNDIGLYGIDKTITNWGVLLDLIHSTCPDITVYIQSMTPVWTGGEKGKLNNENVLKYNAQLKNFAESNGYKYIDIHPYMQDSTGGLATCYCSDSYVHLTNEGAQRWIAVLKAYTGY